MGKRLFILNLKESVLMLQNGHCIRTINCFNLSIKLSNYREEKVVQTVLFIIPNFHVFINLSVVETKTLERDIQRPSSASYSHHHFSLVRERIVVKH